MNNLLPIRILREYLKWRKNWDDLCNRCGRCCYSRSVTARGEVIIHYECPCQYLDTEKKTCRVFDRRFKTYSSCQKVNLFRALFHRSLPTECAYAKTFRLWKKNEFAEHES